MKPTSNLPFGATLAEGGAHFAVQSRHATQIHVCLHDGDKEVRRIALNKTGTDRHEAFIKGAREGQHYGLRADGPWSDTLGHRFDPSKLLLDPYATEITGHVNWHEDLALRAKDTGSLMPKCVLRAPLPDTNPLPPKKPNFILEVPVKAFTKLHPDVPEKLRGTIGALASPPIIQHFKRIGCDVIELMPIAAWTDERHLARIGLSNAWGYNSVSFFAPEPTLAPGGLAEIRNTVKVLHDNGIRVLLDVVFNHTGESDYGGGTISLRGLDNATYFNLSGGTLINDTGTGNTLALDRQPVVDLVIRALRHWVQSTGVDGFRYDLATVMGRTDSGFTVEAPLIAAIQQDLLLAPLIHIPEPWDVGPGGYQLGSFPDAWHEWNDHFRDDVRRYWRGDAGARGKFATRLAGSSDIFKRGNRKPSASVNFIAAHDGFALADVVRYARKQNLANGEGNRDGNDGEVSWIDANPPQKTKSMLASLFCARGIVMLTAGDELGRTQKGNNNAYAQDNEITWTDWKNADQDLIGFVSALAKFRQDFSDYFEDRFLDGKTNARNDNRDIVWFGADGEEIASADWLSPASQTLGLLLASRNWDARLVLIFDSGKMDHVGKLPPARANSCWQPLPISKGVTGFAAYLEKPAQAH
jgi:glycogen debranching enzyme